MGRRCNIVTVCFSALVMVGCASQPVARGRVKPGEFAIDASTADAIAGVIEEDLRGVFLTDPPTEVVGSRFYWGPLDAIYSGHDHGNRSIYGLIVIHPDDVDEWEAGFEELARPGKLPDAPLGVSWWMTEAEARDAEFFNCGIKDAGAGSFIAVSGDGSRIYLYVAQWGGKTAATRPTTQ